MASTASKSPLWSTSNRYNLLMGMVIFGSVLIGLWGIFSWIPTWIQSLLPEGQSGQQERGFTMMLLGSGGIVGGILSGFLIKKLGVRSTFLLTRRTPHRSEQSPPLTHPGSDAADTVHRPTQTGDRLHSTPRRPHRAREWVEGRC